MKRFAFASLVLAGSLAWLGAPRAELLVTIGTGAVNGVYYPAGGSICRLVNLGRRAHGIRCAVEVTTGSIQNTHAVLANEMDLGIVQTDVQHAAVNQTGPFADHAAGRQLRVLFALHAEPFTVLARADAGLGGFEDLKGRRVNIGEPRSGTRPTLEHLLKAYGFGPTAFAAAPELGPAQAGAALCENKIDALVYVVGHPNAAIRSITETCAARLVPVVGAAVDAAVKAHPYYSEALIPGRLYIGNDRSTRTFGVRASVVARESLPEAVAYEVTKAVLTNLADFRLLHPAFQALVPERMLAGNTAPWHPGALRYLREAGLLK